MESYLDPAKAARKAIHGILDPAKAASSGFQIMIPFSKTLKVNCPESQADLIDWL